MTRTLFERTLFHIASNASAQARIQIPPNTRLISAHAQMKSGDNCSVLCDIYFTTSNGEIKLKSGILNNTQSHLAWEAKSLFMTPTQYPTYVRCSVGNYSAYSVDIYFQIHYEVLK